MKSLTQPASKALVALALLTFATAPFAQDDVEEEGGGWFSGVTSFFSNLFSSGDDEDESASEPGESMFAGFGGGIEWYAGADAGVTKHQSRALHSASGSYSAYGGGTFSNRIGFELGYLDMADADIRGSSDTLGVTGYRGGITYSTETGDAPVRLGLGMYSADGEVGSVKESTDGAVFSVKLEQAVTQHLYLTLGTDVYFGMRFGSGGRSDAIMFGIGLAFHTSPPAPAEAEDDGGIGVAEPAYEEAGDVYETPDSYETPAYEEAPADDMGADDSAADESYE